MRLMNNIGDAALANRILSSNYSRSENPIPIRWIRVRCLTMHDRIPGGKVRRPFFRSSVLFLPRCIHSRNVSSNHDAHSDAASLPTPR